MSDEVLPTESFPVTSQDLDESVPSQTDVEEASPNAIPADATEHDAQVDVQSVTMVQKTGDELEALRRSLDELSQLFSKRLQYDEEKETIIDRQHHELVELREGIKSELVRPLLYDIAQVLDDVHKMRAGLGAADSNADGLLEQVEYLMLDILEKNDVEQVESKQGELFAALQQRIVKSEETSDAAKAKTIAHSLAPGYMFGKNTLFKEKVVVYKLVESVNQPNVFENTVGSQETEFDEANTVKDQSETLTDSTSVEQSAHNAPSEQ